MVIVAHHTYNQTQKENHNNDEDNVQMVHEIDTVAIVWWKKVKVTENGILRTISTQEDTKF